MKLDAFDIGRRTTRRRRQCRSDYEVARLKKVGSLADWRACCDCLPRGNLPHGLRVGKMAAPTPTLAGRTVAKANWSVKCFSGIHWGMMRRLPVSFDIHGGLHRL